SFQGSTSDHGSTEPADAMGSTHRAASPPRTLETGLADHLRHRQEVFHLLDRRIAIGVKVRFLPALAQSTTELCAAPPHSSRSRRYKRHAAHVDLSARR